MTGPIFICRNGVSALDLWLQFVPKELLQKIWEGNKAKNSDIWKYPSTKSDAGKTSYRQINGGKFSARLLYGFFMQQIRVLGLQNRPSRSRRNIAPLKNSI
jgi:hypothetical protein